MKLKKRARTIDEDDLPRQQWFWIKSDDQETPGKRATQRANECGCEEPFELKRGCGARIHPLWEVEEELEASGPLDVHSALKLIQMTDVKHKYRVGERGQIERKAGKSWHKICRHEHMEKYCKLCKKEKFAEITDTLPYPWPDLEYMQKTYTKHKFRKSAVDGKVQKHVGNNRWFAVCGHNKIHRKCEYCGGEDLCIRHHIQKDRCAECFEELAHCPCGKRWELCILCHGSAMCLNHPTVPKGNCVPCGGYKLCRKCERALSVHDGFCRACHPDFVPSPVGASKEACEWLTLVNTELGPGIFIQRRFYDIRTKEWSGKEYRIPEWRAKSVDGFHIDPITGHGVIHEYFGEDIHGHPRGWIGKEDATDRFGKNRKEIS